VLGLAGEVGTLAPGACADLAVLRKSDGVWQTIQTIRAGQMY
jgi:imidazolonepropionase-like amidohydrolase